MIRLFVTLGIILYFDLFFVVALKIKFGKALPLSYVSLVLLFFGCSFFRNLSLIKYAVVLTAILVGIYYFYLYKNNKLNLKENLNNFFRPSMVVFALFFLYLSLVLSNRGLFNIDDFLHWGAMVKDIIRNNELYPIDKFVLVPPGTYPPFTTLLEGLFNKFLGGYNESSSLLALSSFMFSYFLQFLDRYEFKKEDILKTVITFFTLIALTLSIQLADQMFYRTFFYNCTYVDWTLAVVLASAMFNLTKYEGKAYDYLNVIYSIVVLLLTKQIGVALALLVFASFIIVFVLHKKIGIKKILFTIISILAIITIFFWSWQSFIGVITDSNLLSDIYHVVNNAFNMTLLTQEQINIFNNFVVALFAKPLILHPIKMSYILIICVVFALLYILGKIKNEKNTKIISLFYLLGGLGYAFAMMLFYVFILGGKEGDSFVMFGRYMQTYTYCGFLLVFWVLINKTINIKSILLVLALSILFIEPLSLESLVYNPNYEKFRSEEINDISSWIENEYDNQPLVVINSTDMAYKTLLKYTFDSKGENVTFYQALDGLEDFKKVLDENEMIFIAEFDELFFNNCWNKITDSVLYNCTLYKINKIDNDNYEFEMIYTWDD